MQEHMLGKHYRKCCTLYSGIAQMGGVGGVLEACQDGLGHLFREELSEFKGAFACF